VLDFDLAAAVDGGDNGDMAQTHPTISPEIQDATRLRTGAALVNPGRRLPPVRGVAFELDPGGRPREGHALQTSSAAAIGVAGLAALQGVFGMIVAADIGVGEPHGDEAGALEAVRRDALGGCVAVGRVRLLGAGGGGGLSQHWRHGQQRHSNKKFTRAAPVPSAPSTHE
jgi:hypothetical protein